MPLALNGVFLTGDVGDVIFASTYVKNDPVVSFMLCSESRENYPTWVKCSAYGEFAKLVQRKNLEKGDRVELLGELCNRRSKHNDRLELEVKITRQLNIFKRGNNRRETEDL